MSQGFELTTREAKAQILLSYHLLQKARARRSRLVLQAKSLNQEVAEARRKFDAAQRLRLQEHNARRKLLDEIHTVYTRHDYPRARQAIARSLTENGLQPTLQKLRTEPESFASLRGQPGSYLEQRARHRAQDAVARMETFVAFRDSYTNGNALSTSPQHLAQLETSLERTTQARNLALGNEVNHERSFAESIHRAGGRGFVERHLPEVATEAERVLPTAASYRHRQAAPSTNFAAFQQKIDHIEKLADRIPATELARSDLTHSQAQLTRALREIHAETAQRDRLLGELRTHYRNFQSRLEDAYAPSQLATARQRIAESVRSNGRRATARQLAEEPQRFGRLRGLPMSAEKKAARKAAARAGRDLRAFEKLRSRFPHLAPRTPRQAVPMLRRELQQLAQKSRALPSIRSLQRDLTRAVEAAGGLSNVASHLRTPTLGLVERAFSLVRSFARGKSR